MTTILDRPTPAEAEDGAAARQRPGRRSAHRRPPLMRPYLGYLGYFVGAGLISGGIVHHPLDPGFYSRIALAGVGLFLAATVLNEIVLAQAPLSPRAVARVIAASLVLSIGIGMLSGGIQHFTDFPTRSATLVPVGMVLSFAAYMVRNGVHGQHRRLGAMAVAVVAAAALAYVGLQSVAAGLVQHGTGSHSHGTPATEGTAPADAGHEDAGHEDAGHDGHSGEHAEPGSEPAVEPATQSLTEPATQPAPAPAGPAAPAGGAPERLKPAPADQQDAGQEHDGQEHDDHGHDGH